MTDANSVIVVGASAAGISCVRALREYGFVGKIILIDKDKNGAYERPPLSKGVLLDGLNANDISMLTEEDVNNLNIEIFFGQAVVEISPQDRTVRLASGEVLTADNVVVATGGEARRLQIEGADLPQVLVLRHLQDAVMLRNKIADNQRVAVVGGGFIGAETVASLRKLDKQVFWLTTSLPLSHILPEQLSQQLVDYHCDTGAQLMTNVSIENIVEQSDGTVSIGMADGTTLNVDVVVLGVGMVPETSFLTTDSARLILNEEQGGISVNEQQCTTFTGVYAAGDVAAVSQKDGIIVRHQHWQAAQFQGERVAATILGKPAPLEPVDWFWSDQGDIHIEMAGCVSTLVGEIVVRNEIDSEWPVYFCVNKNKVIGAVSVNAPNAVRAALRMIRNDVFVDPTKLADPNIDLRKLMRG